MTMGSWHQDSEREELAAEIQAHQDDLLKELGLFRKKAADDLARFGRPKRDPLQEVRVN